MPETQVHQNPKVLSPGEEKAIDSTLEDLKNVRDGVEIMQGVNFESRSQDQVDKKIADLERVKRNFGLPELSQNDKMRAERELELLTADLQKDMPSWGEYYSSRPQDGARHTFMVHKIVKWDADPIRRQKVQRWKILRRMVHRDDPQASNVMYLFKQ